MMDLRRPLVGAAHSRLDLRGYSIRSHAMDTRGREHIAAGAQMTEQCELERARPRPQLAHRERRDGLEGADESLKSMSLEPSRARPDQLEGECVDPGKPGELVGSDKGKPPEE